MRIAEIAPLYESVPPTTYGGTERVVAAVCDGLVARGHDVTLFAAGGSVTRAELRPAVPMALRRRFSRDELVETAPHHHLRMLSEVYASDEFDIVHAHTDIWTLPFAAVSPVPTLLTLHGRLDMAVVRDVMRMYPRVPLVSISDSQRRPVADLDLSWVATVPHGLDLDRYLQQPRPGGDHLAFVGRVCHEKGIDTAIAVAREAGRELQIAAKVDPLDVDYFKSRIEPLLGEDTPFVGEIGEYHKPEFFASAAATLFPINWPEPFGLVMIESLAAGTPVIAFGHGSVPEILVDGVTGFICQDVTDMVEAIGRLDEIDPDECRHHARRFTVDRMCARYEALFARLVGVPPRFSAAAAS